MRFIQIGLYTLTSTRSFSSLVITRSSPYKTGDNRPEENGLLQRTSAPALTITVRFDTLWPFKEFFTHAFIRTPVHSKANAFQL
mgnify:CR=1 FL=1